MKKRVWHAPVSLKQWAKNEKRYKVFLAMEQSDNYQKTELKNQLFLTTLPFFYWDVIKKELVDTFLSLLLTSKIL